MRGVSNSRLAQVGAAGASYPLPLSLVAVRLSPLGGWLSWLRDLALLDKSVVLVAKPISCS